LHPLHGIGVLVTRPRHQAATLCRLLEAEGAAAHLFPAIEIVPMEDRRSGRPAARPLASYDLVVFASANAVRFGAALLEERRDLTLAAVGPATANALNQAGYRVAVQSAEGADSESLLAHPKLTAAAGTRILIVKGSGGRGLLERELVRRGAQVSCVEVYRRECSRPGAAEIARLTERFAAREIQVITATSLEIGTNLLALATPALRRAFDAVHWVVPSARIADGLRERNLEAPLLMARSAMDQDLVSAIAGWRGAESGA
jgi:uroporphyrinogen-III synthase